MMCGSFYFENKSPSPDGWENPFRKFAALANKFPKRFGRTAGNSS